MVCFRCSGSKRLTLGGMPAICDCEEYAKIIAKSQVNPVAADEIKEVVEAVEKELEVVEVLEVVDIQDIQDIQDIDPEVIPVPEKPLVLKKRRASSKKTTIDQTSET